MAFAHKDWKDDPDSSTPLSAAALEDMEDRLAGYTDTQVAGAQPLDSDLTAIAALTTTSYGRALLALADAAAGRTALGLGTAATQATGAFDAAGAAAAVQAASQPLDSDLTAIAALTTTTFGRSFLALADAAAARAAIGSGTPSSGTYLDGDGAWTPLPAQSGSAEDVAVNPAVAGATDVQGALEAVLAAQDGIAAAGLPAGAGVAYVQETSPAEGDFPWIWVPVDGDGVQVGPMQFYAPAAASIPVFTVDPVISGTGVVGDTLTCNGGTATGAPTPTKTYQWKNAGVPISGETASTYVVRAGDVGDAITCDVTAANASGSDTATSNTITPSAAPTVPGQPTGLTLTPGDGQIAATWTAPASNGGSAITTYLVEWRSPSGTGSYTTFAHSPSTTPSITITGVPNDVQAGVRVSAVNAVGTGSPTAEATATPTASGGTVVFEDDLTDTDAVLLEDHTPSPTGTGWTRITGGAYSDALAFKTNRVFSGDYSLYYEDDAPAGAEYDIDFDFYVASATGFIAAVARGTFVDTPTHYEFRIMGDGTLALKEVTAGTYTDVDTGTWTATVGNSYVGKVEVRDASKRLLIGGVEVLSITTNVITQVGKAGLSGGGSTATTGMHVADFKVTDA